MSKERDLCVRKDKTLPRRKERIPIICNLIKELWMEDRRVDEEIGFYRLIHEELDYNMSFYKEEDEWYDILTNKIKIMKKEKTQYKLTREDKLEMTQIVRYFENFWTIYSDLRLSQIIQLVIEEIYTAMKRNTLFDFAFWKKFFVPTQLNILQASLNALQSSLDLTMATTDDSFVDYDKITSIEKLTKAIEVTRNKIDELKKEYDE